MRKKQMLLYRNHLTVNQTFSTINGISIQSRHQEAICEALRKFLLGRSLILLGISFQSFTPKREILSKSPLVVKPGSQFVFCKMGHLPPFPLRVNDEVL